MPAERRNLRSNKDNTSSEKPRSNSQSSSNTKDKPVPSKAPLKGKPQPAKKPAQGAEDKPHLNGQAVENGVNGISDVEMKDDGAEGGKGEDEMTVVVPPPKSTKLAGHGHDPQEDVKMEGGEETAAETEKKDKVDPKEKALSGEYFCQYCSWPASC